jgi:HEAT repeat protein
MSFVLALAVLWTGEPVRAADPDPLATELEGKPLRTWLEYLVGQGNSTPEDNANARAALRSFGAKPDRAVPALTAALADKDEFVRIAAAQCLGYYCEADAKVLVPPLLKALQADEASSVRASAACSLSVIAPEDKAVVAALLKALKDDKAGSVRKEVLYDFAYNHGFRYKESPAGVYPAVVEAFKDTDEDVRVMAVLVVGKIGDPKVTIPLLIDNLGAKWDMASAAQSALGGLCPQAIPALCKALKDKNPKVRSGALFALSLGGNKPLIRKELASIVPLLNDEDTTVRSHAARLLGDIEATDAVPALIARLSDEKSCVRCSCVSALGRMKATDAVPALVARLEDKDGDVRRACLEALGSIRPDAAATVEKVIDRLKNDPDRNVRHAAAVALGEIGAKTKEVVPALIAGLQDTDVDVVVESAYSLGQIGTNAKAAIPNLNEALKSKNERVRKAAYEALPKVDPVPPAEYKGGPGLPPGSIK